MDHIAIVGMDIHYGEAEGAESFSCLVYDGGFDEKASFRNNIEVLVKGAIGNTISNPSFKDLHDTALIILSGDASNDLTSGFPEFYHEDTFIEAFGRMFQILSEGSVRSVIMVSDKGAIVCKSEDVAVADNDRIYAVVENKWSIDGCDKELPFKPEKIGYIEVSGEPSFEFLSGRYEGLTQYFSHLEKRSVASGASPDEMTSCIKTALILHNRFLPSGKLYQYAEQVELWDRSPFYVPFLSRSFFTRRQQTTRKALLVGKTNDELFVFHMSEYDQQKRKPARYLARSAPLFFPISGDSFGELDRNLEELREKINSAGENIRKISWENYNTFCSGENKAFVVSILGDSLENLNRELRFVQSGLKNAFDNGSNLKTPGGSYFAPEPLASNGKVVFVYPGVGSAYTGLGQDLFQMFPAVFDFFSGMVPDVSEFLKTNDLYPRTSHMISDEERKILDKQLRKNIMEISQCGMSFSVIYTMIISGIFNVFPEFAMGYSMGEASMMASQMVWKNPAELGVKLKNTDVFSGGLNGKLTAVRKAWGFPPEGTDRIWESYTLFEDRKVIEEAVKGQERVYITLINTNQEVVIAGYPEDCLKVIEKIGCKYFPLNLDLAIHSGPAYNEYDKMLELYTLELGEKPFTKFYSSSCYLPIPVRSKSVAHSISKAFCDTVDFPRLVNKVYDDGGRIFIETGPRMICSQWIDQILSDKPHLTVPLDIKGIKSQVTMSKAVSMLLSHRVKMDIKCLFNS